MFEGETEVVRAGAAGVARRDLPAHLPQRRARRHEGAAARTSCASRSTRSSGSAPRRRRAANFAGGNTVWDQLAQCESGGNWAINTGNGYYGGLQFSLGTWQSYGGPGCPHQQSRETQIAIAEKVRAATGGYGSWPACSQSLGLPQ